MLTDLSVRAGAAGFLAFLPLSFSFAQIVNPALVIEHDGMNDPSTEGWSPSGGNLTGTEGPGKETTATGEHFYWNIDDQVEQIRIYEGLVCNGPIDIDWLFEVSVRVVNTTIVPFFEIGGVFFGVDDGHTQWGWYLENNLAGVFSPPAGYHFSIPLDTRSDYVNYKIVLSRNEPGLQDDTADFLVNDVLMAEDIGRGVMDSTNNLRFARWGTASGAAVGNANYETVRFTIDADGDGDGVSYEFDNCLNVSNPAQRDSDGDGFGNFCDADLNNDGATNFQDLALMKEVFFSNDPDADLNGDGSVNFVDLGTMKSLFFLAAGPTCAEVPTGVIDSIEE